MLVFPKLFIIQIFLHYRKKQNVRPNLFLAWESLLSLSNSRCKNSFADVTNSLVREKATKTHLHLFKTDQIVCESKHIKVMNV